MYVIGDLLAFLGFTKAILYKLTKESYLAKLPSSFSPACQYVIMTASQLVHRNNRAVVMEHQLTLSIELIEYK